MEMAQAYAAFGSRVTMIEAGPSNPGVGGVILRDGQQLLSDEVFSSSGGGEPSVCAAARAREVG